MRALIGCSLVVGLSCMSATIRVERRGSGAPERDFQFVPTPGTDDHFITFPAYPLANCLDVPQADGGLHDESLREEACSNSKSLADFLGYWDQPPHGTLSWLTDQTKIRQALPMRCTLDVDPQDERNKPVVRLSFLHFSDVQIREPSARLGGRTLSQQLDPIIESFQRSYEQELYSMFVYAGLVETVNKEVAKGQNTEHETEPVPDPNRPAPTFMIHTGDSVDAGLRSEFQTFRDVSDRLNIPWYSVIGNHDVLAFGNLQMKAKPNAEDKDEQRKACDTERVARDSRLVKEREAHERWSRTGTNSELLANIAPRSTRQRADKQTQDEGRDLALCEGGYWEDSGRACTCTRISDLLREEVLSSTPTNNLGERREISGKTRAMMMVPAAIERVCLQHEVEADSFVMDPNLTVGKTCRSPARAFMEAHCNPGPSGCQQHLAGQNYALIPPKRTSSLYEGIEKLCGSTYDPTKLQMGMHPSSLHGYDLDRDRRGFYCFEAGAIEGTRTSPARKIWAVALNTSSEVGAYGEVSDEQLSWLLAVLRQIGKYDLVMLFGHHPVYDIYDPEHRYEFNRMITSTPQVVGYFTGHTHSAAHRILHPKREDEAEKFPLTGGQHHVWEIVAPSVIAFPQQGRQVTLKTLGDKLGYFEIVAFSPKGTGDSASKIDQARAGAERDVCNEPSGCVDDKPPLPSRAVSFSRLFFRMPEYVHEALPKEAGCEGIHDPKM